MRTSCSRRLRRRVTSRLATGGGLTWRALGIAALTAALCSTAWIPTAAAQEQAAEAQPIQDQVTQGQGEIDPSIPTNLYTNIDFNFELQDHPGDGDMYGLNVIGAIAFNDRNRLDIELPIHRSAYLETENKTGLGDIRLRYFWIGFKNDDPSARFTAAGLSFDTYLPTGDPDTGHGSGSTLIAPGVTFGFRATEWLDLFPMISYQHSFGEGRRQPGGPDNGGTPLPPGEKPDETARTRGIRIEVVSVIPLPRDSWLQLIPLYSRDFETDAQSANLRTQFGIMINPKNAFQIEYQGELISERTLQHMIRVAWSYFL